MLRHISALIRKTKEEGIGEVLKILCTRISALLSTIHFIWSSMNASESKNDLMVVLRGEKPESDTIALINQIEDSNSFRKLYVVSENKDSKSYANNSVEHIYKYSTGFSKALSLSKCVCVKNERDLRFHRLVSQQSQKFILLQHGPITKAKGKSRSSERQNKETKLSISLDNPPKSLTRSVQSDTELYFRSSSEGRHPAEYEKLGYPRFDRVKQLASGLSDPILPSDSLDTLTYDDCVNILYAPTHKDGVFETTYFPFSDFNKNELYSFLDENDMRIFMRPHPTHKSEQSHLIDGENVFLADQDFAESATELLAHIDILITDYSSIYMEFLPFDRPIIFLKDNYAEFSSHRGLAFDYETYFPGKNPDTFNEFRLVLEEICNNNIDEYSDERCFVKKSFLPNNGTVFVKNVREWLDSK